MYSSLPPLFNAYGWRIVDGWMGSNFNLLLMKALNVHDPCLFVKTKWSGKMDSQFGTVYFWNIYPVSTLYPYRNDMLVQALKKRNYEVENAYLKRKEKGNVC